MPTTSAPAASPVRGWILSLYHLRVGQITHDTRLPEGNEIVEQRLDETETGDATTVTLVNTKRPADLPENAEPEDVAKYLGSIETPQILSAGMCSMRS